MNKVFVDYRISEEEHINLIKNNVDVIICPACPDLYTAICGHPDILIHFLDDRNIVVHNKIDVSFISLLESFNLNIILSEKSLETMYPNNIYLNAVSTNSIFLHKLNATDKSLLNYNINKKQINVKQGYSKCSTVIVSNSSFITSDNGIYTALKNQDLDVLLLPPGDILLPGLNYGFIGGCCGLISKDKMAFYGSLDFYEYGNEVKKFLKKYDIEPIYLSLSKLKDRGSILSLFNCL